MRSAESYLTVLQKCRLFKDIAPDEIETAISLMSGKVGEYKKNEILHGDYEKYDFFGLVLDGMVEALIDDIDGNRMIMAEVLPGRTFAESLAFLKIENSPVYIYAPEKSAVLWLKADSLFDGKNSVLKQKLQRNFTEIIAMRPLLMNRRIGILSKVKLRDKIIAYLSSLSDEKGKKVITVPLNREDMATYIGANRAALSRELSLMKKEGLIDYYKNTFYILH